MTAPRLQSRVSGSILAGAESPSFSRRSSSCPVAKVGEVALVERANALIVQFENADDAAVHGHQRMRGVEADEGLGGDQGVVAEARVLPRIVDREGVARVDRVPRERYVACELRECEPDARLEPDPPRVDQCDRKYGSVENPLREPCDTVEAFLGRGVEQRKRADGLESRRLVEGKRWTLHRAKV